MAEVARRFKEMRESGKFTVDGRATLEHELRGAEVQDKPTWQTETPSK